MLLWQRVLNDLNILTEWLISDKLSLEENNRHIVSGQRALITSRTSEAESFPNLSEHATSDLKRYWKIRANYNYSFRLKDESLIQCFYTFNDNNIIKQKFGYYECPFITPGKPEASEEESPELQDMPNEDFEHFEPKLANSLSLHFDFDPNTYTDIHHPKTHLSLGNHRGCRMPVAAPLRLMEFMEFLIKNFYCEHWDSLKSFIAERRGLLKELSYERTISDGESQHLHVQTVAYSPD